MKECRRGLQPSVPLADAADGRRPRAKASLPIVREDPEDSGMPGHLIAGGSCFLEPKTNGWSPRTSGRPDSLSPAVSAAVTIAAAAAASYLGAQQILLVTRCSPLCYTNLRPSPCCSQALDRGARGVRAKCGRPLFVGRLPGGGASAWSRSPNEKWLRAVVPIVRQDPAGQLLFNC